MISRKTVNAVLLSAVALTVGGGISAARAADVAAAPEQEKCYGVAKAGKNDCANVTNTHSCAGQATEAGARDEYVLLPKGLCDKINNGTTEPAAAPPENPAH